MTTTRIVYCPCGHLIGSLNSPEEDAHYVWSIRTDGTRSNLGYCPERRGLDRAIAEAKMLSGRALYRGEEV